MSLADTCFPSSQMCASHLPVLQEQCEGFECAVCMQHLRDLLRFDQLCFAEEKVLEEQSFTCSDV